MTLPDLPFFSPVSATGSIALIDCENLTAGTQLQTAIQWRSFLRTELFGRESAMAPWRSTLAGLGIAIHAETEIAPDAPSQAADQAMAARVDQVLAQGWPGGVAIASNDRGFDADIARLRAAGIKAIRRGDLRPGEILALVVIVLGGGDWVGAGGVGDHLARRFGISIRGRLADLARSGGVTIRQTRSGPELRV